MNMEIYGYGNIWIWKYMDMEIYGYGNIGLVSYVKVLMD